MAPFPAWALIHKMTEKGLKVGRSVLDFYNKVTEIALFLDF